MLHQIDLYTPRPHKLNLQASTATHPPPPSPLFTESSSLSCSNWLAAWVGLPPCECVASSSDNPPINRYSTLSCALPLPDVNVIFPCCLPPVWFLWVQTWQNIQQSCIFLCWFLMHVLRITCPCGWRGRAVFFFLSVFSVLFNSSSVPLFLSHPIIVIAIWIFVFGLSGVGLIVHLCAALAASSICHIYCTSMQFSDGVQKSFTLFGTHVTSHYCSWSEELEK